MEAKKQGFDDALFIDPASAEVSEGSTWNIGFVTGDGAVIWPDASVLPGVTMALLRTAVSGQVSRTVAAGEIAQMRAAFATNAGFGVRAIAAIDDHEFDVEDLVIAELQKGYIAIPGDRL